MVDTFPLKTQTMAYFKASFDTDDELSDLQWTWCGDKL